MMYSYDCKVFGNEFAKAAIKLKQQNPSFVLAKIDAQEQGYIAERFGVQKYPHLIFFKQINDFRLTSREGVQLEYDGGKSEGDIISWFLKKSSTYAPEITCPQIKDKIQEHRLITIFFGDQYSFEFNKIFQELLQYQVLAKKYAFFHLNDQNCAKYYGISQIPKLVIFNQQMQNNKPILYEGVWDLNPVIQFMHENSILQIMEFGEEHIEIVFSDQKPSIILFRGQNQKNFAFNKVFSDLSYKYKEQMYFVMADVTQPGIQHRLGDFMNVLGDIQPCIRILDPSQNFRKYAYPTILTDLSVEKLTKFVDEFLQKSMIPHYKSQSAPSSNSGPVKTIVESTFQQEVIDHDRDIILLVYSTQYPQYQQALQLWNQFGQELRVVRNLIVAQIDVYLNDIHHYVDVTALPQIKIFPKGKKHQGIDYHGKMNSIEDFRLFLQDNSRAYREYLHLEYIRNNPSDL
ncbi:disulfide isomerase [Stylonychia lemnae]|uniref:Disulfide isomerase n=1 Tax=Stylonychia lemnae TaxID=5949 RepID=A0A078AY96_STYLE|nr:disulfide isomerase [Stylonychia lemnae]|eukprot:CDW87106.1 disulfide isomerase [Stylonychia lemnae]